MSQIINIESFGDHDPAVLVWQEAFKEAAKVVPDAVEAIAKKLGGTVLLSDQAA